MVAAVSVALAGWQVIADQPWAVALAVVGALSTAAVIVFGLREERRGALADRFTEAVCQQLAGRPVRPQRNMVRFSHWKRWPTGYPGRMSLRYDAAINADDPLFQAGLLATVERFFGSRYKVAAVGLVRGRIHLKAVPPKDEVIAPEVPEVPEVVRRAEAIVGKAFTQGASAEVGQDAEGNVSRLEVKYTVDKRFARIFNRHEVDSTVTAFLKGRWRSKWDLENDVVVYERRKPLPSPVLHPRITPLPGTAIENYDRVRIPFAIDEDGQTHYWDPAINPHFLVAGTSGSGKTVLMHGICAEFCAQGWPVWIVDGKATEFIGFRRWPNVQLVGTSIMEQVRIIHRIHELMEARIGQITREEAQEEDFEPMLLGVDEFKAFKQNLTRLYRKVKVKGDPTEPEALGLVSDIASRGRSIRFHLLIGLQRPDAAFLTGDMRDNFGARASMGKLSRDGATMMWGDTRTGTSLPKQARGRGITSDDNGDPVEVQVYWTPDPRKATKERKPEDFELLESLKPAETIHPRLHVVAPGSVADIDGDGTPEITYFDWATARIVPWTPEYGVSSPSGAHKGAAAGAAEADDEEEAPAFTDWDLEYGEAESVRVDDVEDGDLVCLDEDGDVWASVEAVYEDPEDDSAICLDWRTDDDASGTEVFSTGTVLDVRKLIDNMEEAEEAA
ncbi:cell division protein FtsK [Arthrobacter sp. GAS37]|uniref:cell division protein FtsK n=1 Tax=Arthrobacter sp. GAS37 TaxID=3156261 RepID=UPI00384E4114